MLKNQWFWVILEQNVDETSIFIEWIESRKKSQSAQGYLARRDVRSRLKASMRIRSKNVPSRSPTQLAATRAAAGFSPQSGSPGGGLTATYCTPNARTFST